jgi:NADPH2:quinone reductase
MKALLSHNPGGPETLSIEEIDSIDAAPDEVVVAVRACGVNFTDGLMISDRYQFRPPRPFSPGAEISGVITSVGSRVTDVVVGTRVAASVGWGGLAEQVAVKADALIPLPKSMPFSDAAALLFTFCPAYYGLHSKATIQAGERVLVLGAGGGIGLASVQIAKAAGALVTAGVSSDAKAAVAHASGAQNVVIYPTEIRDRETAKSVSKRFAEAMGGPADIVVDPVGGNLAEPALRVMNASGRYLVIGFTGGIPRIPLNLVLLKSCQIMGINVQRLDEDDHAARVAIDRMLINLYELGQIKPMVAHRLPLELAQQAISAVANRHASGKLVVMIGLGDA